MTTLNSVSSLFIQFQTQQLLGAGQQQLYALQAQVASGKKTSDLSTLGASDTRTLLSARSAQTKYAGYNVAINTVSARVQVQSQALAGLQSIATQMNTLISNNQTQTAAQQVGAAGQIQSYLVSAQNYLNQQVEGRYIFAGSRYSTEPVRDLTSLPVPPTEAYPYVPTTTGALPSYDSDSMSQAQVTSLAVNGSGQLVLGSSDWASQGYNVGDTITLTGVHGVADGTTVTIASLAGGTATLTAPLTQTPVTFDQTAATSIVADNAAGTLTLGGSSWAAQGIQVGDTIALNGTAADGSYTVTGLAGGVATVTPAPPNSPVENIFDVTTANQPDTNFSAVRNVANSGSGAYDQDSTYIDDDFLMKYGVSSDDPAIQNLVQGLRWAYAATQDSANYTTYMARASQLMGDASTGIRVQEANTASNIGILKDTQTAHQASIVNFKDQASDVIDVDVNDAATQLSILAAQIQASYAATGRLLQLSIVGYL